MIGCNVEKKSASGRPGQREEVAPRDGGDVRHDPAQPVALTGLPDRAGAVMVVVVMRHPSRRRRRSCAPGARPRFGFAAVSSALLFDLGSVLWPVRLRKTSSRLGSRSARPAIGDLRRVERAQHLGARPAGPSSTVSSTTRSSTTGAFSENGASSGPRGASGIAVAQRHRDDRGPQVGLELGRRPLGDDAPVVDHHDVTGQAVGLLEVLGGEQHRRAVARPAPR